MTDAVAAFIGSVAVIFLVVHLVHGTGWLPYALMLAGLVGAHLCLRAVRYQKRRHARHSPRSRSLPKLGLPDRTAGRAVHSPAAE